MVGLIFIGRLFYLQIIQHDYYREAALADQLKEYAIPAERGIIQAHDGDSVVPLVLNQKLYTIYADPLLAAKNADDSAEKLSQLLKGKSSDYKAQLSIQDSRYQILAKRIDETLEKKILELKMPGIGAQARDYRIYPQGSLAAQMLGFVDDEGTGKYGVEQALESNLAGKPGMLKAITDAGGVPLAASRDNTKISPQPGQDVVLTIDLAMQKQLENILAQGTKHALAPSGDALIMDPNTGAIKAMAGWPTYDPSKFYNVKDPSVFQESAISSPLEPGSTMKAFTMAAALDQGVVKQDTTYNDPAQWKINGFTIRNVEEDGGPGRKSMAQLLNLSLNTGATWLLMQMGGGSINQKARGTWHDYLVNHYHFGKPTGIEQGYEASGSIPDPTNGPARELTYANTSFGQSMAVTPLQMAAALSATLNGGTYYKPHLVEATVNAKGETITNKPAIVSSRVVSASVSGQLKSLMEYVLTNHYPKPPFSSRYSVGGKTGTAQLASPYGGYYEDRFNGTFIGFVGGDKPQYVIMVRVNTPRIGGYAGTTAAMPIFVNLAHMLINNFNVLPKS